MIADNCQIREARLELDKSWISRQVPEWCLLLYGFNLVIGVLITAAGGIVTSLELRAPSNLAIFLAALYTDYIFWKGVRRILERRSVE